jgi:hypothetical protein
MKKRNPIKPGIRAPSAKMFGFQGIIQDESGFSKFRVLLPLAGR